MIKLSILIILLSVKMEHHIKDSFGNGTFELGYGTAIAPTTTTADTKAISSM
jgi:hypothetical protein